MNSAVKNSVNAYKEIDEETILRLKGIVGDEYVLSSEADIESYAHDETPELKHLPGAVVKPGSTEEVSRILRFADENHIAVTPRGGGTGLSGGSIPLYGGISLSLERLNRILEIDKNNLMVTVEPGVIVGELRAAVEREGLLYPVDPASLDSAHIGGNIAECAGGASAVKYGVTKNYVHGLEAVLPTGEILNLGGKLVKNVTGYDLISLIVGSEGTLAVVTKAILRLLPLPDKRVDLLVAYNDFLEASESVRKIIGAKIIPTTIEIMDKKTLSLCRRYLKRSMPFEDAEAHLLIGIDGEDKDEIERRAERIGEICLASGAYDVLIAANKNEQDKLWEARRSIREAMKEDGVSVDEDLVVPRSEVPLLINKIKAICDKASLSHLICGHIGDGNMHVHVFKGALSDDEWKRAVPVVVKALFTATVYLGGMISGEHGIGLSKKDYLGLNLSGDNIKLMKRIKLAFDPNNILNPGKIFDI
ncbi:MAG: hypothetical protein AUJ75_04405 [Candidatus Omnitrophica bacterium CG1_02_49_10]|nr:MAG: hypothetical protein AUJ75_04405 [Candidatus Omnitrophica bacterium CG1_02_49_10]